MMMNRNFRKLCCCVLSSLLLTGCDGSDGAVTGTGQDSDRRVSITATTSSSVSNGDEVMTDGTFKVLAWQRDSVETATGSGVFTYTDELWVGLRTSSGEYIPETVWFKDDGGSQKPWATLSDYYWPRSFVACDFYAVWPVTAPDIGVEPRAGSVRPVRYLDYVNTTGRSDLLLAATTSNSARAAADAAAAGATDGMAKLLFHHALSRVTLKAGCDASTPGQQLSVTVRSVELCNVLQAGTFRFQDLPNSPGDAPVLGVWSLRGTCQNVMLYSDDTGTVLSDAAVALTDAATSALLIPQSLPAWDIANTIAGNNLLATPGAYLKIGCSIAVSGYEGDFTDDGYVYVPFTADWEMNNNYEYTLHFGGGYDRGGHLILQPVTITGTVTPWSAVASQTIDPAWL